MSLTGPDYVRVPEPAPWVPMTPIDAQERLIQIIGRQDSEAVLQMQSELIDALRTGEVAAYVEIPSTGHLYRIDSSYFGRSYGDLRHDCSLRLHHQILDDFEGPTAPSFVGLSWTLWYRDVERFGRRLASKLPDLTPKQPATDVRQWVIDRARDGVNQTECYKQGRGLFGRQFLSRREARQIHNETVQGLGREVRPGRRVSAR